MPLPLPLRYSEFCKLLRIGYFVKYEFKFKSFFAPERKRKSDEEHETEWWMENERRETFSLSTHHLFIHNPLIFGILFDDDYRCRCRLRSTVRCQLQRSTFALIAVFFPKKKLSNNSTQARTDTHSFNDKMQVLSSGPCFRQSCTLHRKYNFG